MLPAINRVTKSMNRLCTFLLPLLLLTSCSSAYYSAMEKVGVHKREIMVDRVVQAKQSQQDAQQQFTSALEQLSALIEFDGGDLETHYQNTQDQYDDSKKAADKVSTHIRAIEDVASALFDEWQDEITQYSSAKLKRQSERKMQETQKHYKGLIRAMHKAEDRMAPILSALKDNTLYLKHNLNAQAIGSLQSEFKSIKQDIEVLIQEMNQAIKQSQQFIDLLDPK
jgi:hypothetical protein